MTLRLEIAETLYFFDEPLLFLAKADDKLYIGVKNEDEGPEEYILGHITSDEARDISEGKIPVRNAFLKRDLFYGTSSGKGVEMSTSPAEVSNSKLPKSGVTLSGVGPQYLVADEDSCTWSHIFTEDSREVQRECRFVFDIEEDKILHLEIMINQGWSPAREDEILDVEDSLKNANPEAISDPVSHDLACATEIPEWASSEDPGCAP